MKRFLPLAMILLTGCAKAAAPAAVSLPVQVEAPAPRLANAAPIVAAPTVTVRPGEAPAAPVEALALPDVPPPTAAEADADDPPMIAAFLEAADADDPYNTDDRKPYGVVVSERSAHTATIAWRTEVPTTGIIEYGRAWGYTQNGFTGRFVDDVAKTDHMITVMDLRRFTGYVFRVTAVTPLGLKFPDKDRKFRTKFWSWR